MNADGEDLTPACRTPGIKQGAWPALLNNMTEALQAANRPIPKYFEISTAEYGAATP